MEKRYPFSGTTGAELRKLSASQRELLNRKVKIAVQKYIKEEADQGRLPTPANIAAGVGLEVPLVIGPLSTLCDEGQIGVAIKKPPEDGTSDTLAIGIDDRHHYYPSTPTIVEQLERDGLIGPPKVLTVRNQLAGGACTSPDTTRRQSRCKGPQAEIFRITWE